MTSEGYTRPCHNERRCTHQGESFPNVSLPACHYHLAGNHVAIIKGAENKKGAAYFVHTAEVLPNLSDYANVGLLDLLLCIPQTFLTTPPPLRTTPRSNMSACNQVF